MLAAALVLGSSGQVQAASPPPPDQSAQGSATAQPTTEGFPTPEAAIREYLAGVAAADADRILGASAIDEVSAGFDFAAAVDRLQAFIPGDTLGSAEYPFYADINRATLSHRILGRCRTLPSACSPARSSMAA